MKNLQKGSIALLWCLSLIHLFLDLVCNFCPMLNVFFVWSFPFLTNEEKPVSFCIFIMYHKGDQSWVFTERPDVEAETPILWPPDAKS